MSLSRFIIAATAAIFLATTSVQAGFTIEIDDNDLEFNGPGTQTFDLLIRSTDASDTLSGYTIRFGSPADASQGVLPSGVSFDAAIEGLTVATPGLFDFNDTTNSVAATNVAADVTVPSADTTLFSIEATLGNAASYTIGVDFQNAQRGGLLATDISNEFFAPNDPRTDFTFTLTNVSAVPEPSSMIMIGTLAATAVGRRKRVFKFLRRQK